MPVVLIRLVAPVPTEKSTAPPLEFETTPTVSVPVPMLPTVLPDPKASKPPSVRLPVPAKIRPLPDKEFVPPSVRVLLEETVIVSVPM